MLAPTIVEKRPEVVASEPDKPELATAPDKPVEASPEMKPPVVSKDDLEVTEDKTVLWIDGYVITAMEENGKDRVEIVASESKPGDATSTNKRRLMLVDNQGRRLDVFLLPGGLERQEPTAGKAEDATADAVLAAATEDLETSEGAE